MGVSLPVCEVKFDAHAAWGSDKHPDKLSGILDDLEEDCLARLSHPQRGLLRTLLVGLEARVAKLAEEYDVVGRFRLLVNGGRFPGGPERQLDLLLYQRHGRFS